MYYAVSNENIELIELFIKFGAKINETDCYDGLTSLHLACKNFSSPYSPFEKEVKNGTLVPMYKVTIDQDKYKKAVEKKVAIIKILLEYKADPHKKSDDKASVMSGKSTWEYVTKEGNIPEIQELFNKINLPNDLIGDIIGFSIIENNDFN